MFGNIIYDVLKSTMNGHDVLSSFSHGIGETIDMLHKNGLNTQYFVEVKKGLLALGDFFRVLTPQDTKDLLFSLDLSTDVSGAIQQGITEKMSMVEKIQLHALTAMQKNQGQRSVMIQRTAQSTGPAVNIKKITTAPTIVRKSSWLQNSFAKCDGDKNPDISSFIPPLQRKPAACITAWSALDLKSKKLRNLSISRRPCP